MSVVSDPDRPILYWADKYNVSEQLVRYIINAYLDCKKTYTFKPKFQKVVYEVFYTTS